MESAKARLAKGREEIAQVALDYLSKKPGLYQSQIGGPQAGMGENTGGIRYSGGGHSNAVYSNAADVLSNTRKP